MNPPKKLTTQHQNREELETAATQQLQTGETAREFASVEEMLRHDALHTPLPPAIGRRLEQSLKEQGSERGSWWRRWLGGE